MKEEITMKIEFNNLSVGNKKIDFSLEDGDKLAIIGKNGIGKTTLLNEILGLNNIKYINKNVKKASIFQENLLDDELTISDNLKLRSNSKEEYNLAISLLKLFEIIDYTKKYGVLSGGEKRIVNLIRSLMINPELLIMDELSSGIDVSKIKIVWDTIDKELMPSKKIIFTTHYLEELNYANKILFIGNDKVRLFANVTEFFNELPKYKLVINNKVSSQKYLFFDHFEEAVLFAKNQQIDLDSIEILKPTYEDLFEVYLNGGDNDGVKVY